MKPASFAKDIIVDNPTLSRGNHIPMLVATAGLPPEGLEVTLMKVGISNRKLRIPDANPITNDGIICTNRSVFSVAKLLFFDVIPIHMPNQPNATRLTIAVMAAADEDTIATARLGCSPDMLTVAPFQITS